MLISSTRCICPSGAPHRADIFPGRSLRFVSVPTYPVKRTHRNYGLCRQGAVALERNPQHDPDVLVDRVPVGQVRARTDPCTKRGDVVVREHGGIGRGRVKAATEPSARKRERQGEHFADIRLAPRRLRCGSDLSFWAAGEAAAGTPAAGSRVALLGRRRPELSRRQAGATLRVRTRSREFRRRKGHFGLGRLAEALPFSELDDTSESFDVDSNGVPSTSAFRSAAFRAAGGRIAVLRWAARFRPSSPRAARSISARPENEQAQQQDPHMADRQKTKCGQPIASTRSYRSCHPAVSPFPYHSGCAALSGFFGDWCRRMCTPKVREHFLPRVHRHFAGHRSALPGNPVNRDTGFTADCPVKGGR